MALGQAAGTAAHLAIESGTSVRALEVEMLQRRLVKDGQVLTFFRDIDPKDPSHQAMQYWGTKGLFTSYTADSRGPLEKERAHEWAHLAGLKPPDGWKGDQPLTWAEVNDWLGKRSERTGVMSRGEFCRVLFESH